jgi:hypothetical protein
MKRVFVVPALVCLLGAGPVLAMDISFGTVKPPRYQTAVPRSGAELVSDVLTDVAAEVAWNAAKEYGPSAVKLLRKHGPEMLGMTRTYTERAVVVGKQYALQALESGIRSIPRVLPDGMKLASTTPSTVKKSEEKNRPAKIDSGKVSLSRKVALAKDAPVSKEGKPAKGKDSALRPSR